MSDLKFSFSNIIIRYHLTVPMEERALKNENNYLNTNFYSYLETLGGQSSNLNLKEVHFFNTSVNLTSVGS